VLKCNPKHHVETCQFDNETLEQRLWCHYTREYMIKRSPYYCYCYYYCYYCYYCYYYCQYPHTRLDLLLRHSVEIHETHLTRHFGWPCVPVDTVQAPRPGRVVHRVDPLQAV
jgi:hypothetical protein